MVKSGVLNFLFVMNYLHQAVPTSDSIESVTLVNKHQYRAGVVELNNEYWGHTKWGIDRQQTNRHTGVCIELLRN